MTQDHINLLASLIGAVITLDTNNNYVVTSGGTSTTIAPGDVNDALNALVVYLTAQQTAIIDSPNAATLTAIMQTIQSI